MKTICTLSKQVAAAPETAFAAFADIPNCAGRVKEILRIEMLTPGPVCTGSKFKETRKMFGRECTETMEFTAFEPGKRYEIGGNSCGTEFRTEFLFTPEAGGTRVDLTMRSQAKTFFAKIMSPLTGWMMKGAMRKCLQADLDQMADFAARPSPNAVT